jgi:FkbM family methyltransferase
MHVNPNEYLRTLIYYLGTFEPHCLRLLHHYLHAGGTMLDVGANAGIFTLTAAPIIGPKGRIISVEPVPSLAAGLRNNIALNHFDWVTVVEAAAWSGDGVTAIGLPEGGQQSGLYTIGAGNNNSFQVPTRRLDDIVEEQRVGRVDLIKMDIEGAECGALLGASRLLANDRPAVIIEVNPTSLKDCGTSSDELIGILTAAGYQGKVIGRHGMTPIGKIGPKDVLECLFLPNERSSQ